MGTGGPLAQELLKRAQFIYPIFQDLFFPLDFLNDDFFFFILVQVQPFLGEMDQILLWGMDLGKHLLYLTLS